MANEISDPAPPNVGTDQRRSRRRRTPTAGGAEPGLADVARAAGISVASASRALARPELVSDALRQRVLEKASALGYVANAAARSLSTNRSGRVGVVVCDPADPIGLQMLGAAERTLSTHELGVQIRMACASTPPGECARALVASGVDGLLFVGSAPGLAVTAWRGNRATPWADCGPEPNPGGAAGDSIEQRGVELVLAYLRQLDHRRTGIVRQPYGVGGEWLTPARPPLTVVERRVEHFHDTDAVRSAVRSLIEEGATAIVVLADIGAAAALHECRALELTVPGQISVIGWGDSDLARCLEPQLTSVRLPASSIGRAGAERLMAAMAGRDFVWPELALKLVIRASTGLRKS